MRTAFINTLVEEAEQRTNLWLITGDLGYSVLEVFSDKYPDRYVNAGVSEQNMIGMAAGISQTGKTVITYSIGNFATLRCLEQIRNDVCYHNLNVKIVAVGGGVAYGPQGYTHHAVEDLAIMRSLPKLTVLAPGDPIETRLAVQAMVSTDGPFYLRLGKAGEPRIHHEPPSFQIGKALEMRQGKDVTLISTGGMLHTTIQVGEKLALSGISARILSMPCLQPIDDDAIQHAAVSTRGIVTIEEHICRGGLGGAVAEVLAGMLQGHAPLFRAGLKNIPFQKAGDQDYIRHLSRLSTPSLEEDI
ncbi:MAG TPA: transketolase, partial [Verrucomicrobia bacterium]|nr:transketolase [Verrucomicrobiota bacterium]